MENDAILGLINFAQRLTRLEEQQSSSQRLIRLEVEHSAYKELVEVQLAAKDKAVDLYARTLESTLSQLQKANAIAEKFQARTIGIALGASACSGVIVGLILKLVGK